MPQRFSERMRRQRVELILSETAQLIGERGIADLRVEDVAARVGVAKGTVYLDFPGKDELVSATLARCVSEVEERLSEAMATATDEDSRLEEAIVTLARSLTERPYLGILLAPPVPGEPEPLATARESLRGRFEKIAAGACARHGDAAFAAQLTLAAMTVPAWSGMVARDGAEGAARRLLAMFGRSKEVDDG